MENSAPIFRNFPCLLLLLVCAGTSHARKLLVGPGKAYAAPCAASAAAKDGDTVEIDPGVYAGDVCGWTASNLLIRATAPYAHLKADGKNAMGKGTWVIQGKNTTVENIEFSGASVPDENGAGIRQEGENLTLSHCWFHDNENGILSGSANGDILIEYSIFENNGFGDGYTHNMYIGNTRSFTLQYSFSHGAKVGHNVKTRALSNKILFNRISDEAEGTASYEIDMPDGGGAIIFGNVIQQGPKTSNSVIVSYGAESLKNPAGGIYIVHNTLVNDRSDGTFIRIASGAKANVWNNLFVGTGSLISGQADSAGNVATASPAFADRAAYDYRLTAASPAIDKGSNAPAMISVFPFTPMEEYRHPAGKGPRINAGPLDAGAYEYASGSALRAFAPGHRVRAVRRLPGFPPAWEYRRSETAPAEVVIPSGRRLDARPGDPIPSRR